MLPRGAGRTGDRYPGGQRLRKAAGSGPRSGGGQSAHKPEAAVADLPHRKLSFSWTPPRHKIPRTAALSQLLGPDQGVGTAGPSEASRETLSPAYPSQFLGLRGHPGAPWPSPACGSAAGLRVGAIPLCTALFSEGHPSRGDTASSRLVRPATPLFPMRSHAEVLRVMISTYWFWGHKPAQSSGLSCLQGDRW